MLTILALSALLYFVVVHRQRLRWPALTAVMLLPSVAFAGVVADPTTDPLSAWGQIVATWQQHHWIAIGVAVYFVLEVLVKKVPQLSKLDGGRITIVMSAVVAIAGSGVEAFFAGGNLQMVIMAVIASAFAYVHPAATEVAKKLAASV